MTTGTLNHFYIARHHSEKKNPGFWLRKKKTASYADQGLFMEVGKGCTVYSIISNAKQNKVMSLIQ